MNNMSDEELIYLMHEEPESAKDIIFDKYNYLIDIYIKKYARVIHVLQIDEQELRGEALLGFSDGIKSYNQDKDASLSTFLSLCIHRRIRKYIEKQARQKYKVINEALSLDYVKDGETSPLMDILSDDNKFNPLEKLTISETTNEIIEGAKKELSAFEFEVFSYMLQGEKYQSIAAKLNKTPKQIDNTIQRIKLKMHKIIDEL